MFDSDLCLKYINPAGEMLFRASSRHVLVQKASTLMPWPECPVEQRLRDALDTRQPVTEREVTVPLYDGHTIMVSYTVLPLHQSEASPEALVELCRKDHHLRIVREEHLLSQHQATQALLRGLAHEIKNPLGGLRGAAQLLEQEESFREYTRIIVDEVDRLHKLIDRMLGPNLLPKQQRVNIHQVLEHVCGLLEAEHPDGPVIIRDTAGSSFALGCCAASRSGPNVTVWSCGWRWSMTARVYPPIYWIVSSSPWYPGARVERAWGCRLRTPFEKLVTSIPAFGLLSMGQLQRQVNEEPGLPGATLTFDQATVLVDQLSGRRRVWT